ncbi:MAG: hypothetical protein ABW123_28135 [Cystobacter sp.]
MADEKRERDGGTGAFEPGRRHDLDARLGGLHESRNVATGTPALTLVPKADMEWQPEGPCRMSLIYEPARDSVTVDVEQAPVSIRTSELTNLLVLMAGVFKRMEEDDEVEAHLASGPVRRLGNTNSTLWVRPFKKAFTAAGVAVLMLAVGFGAWLDSTPACEQLKWGDLPDDALFFADGEDVHPAVIAYPMPEKPFNQQRKPPCIEGREEEVQGGCWILHTKTAPCQKGTAEHQGKCYVPVKKPVPLARSVRP